MKTQHIKSLLYALFFLFGAVFVALALGSHDPADPSFNSLGHRPYSANLCGLFGSFFSDLLYQMMGITAWGVVGLLFFVSWVYYKQKQKNLQWNG